MTLLYSFIIFLVICFHVYYDYISSLVSLFLHSSMESYSAHLDDHYVGVGISYSIKLQDN
jgi:hypothetical protein